MAVTPPRWPALSFSRAPGHAQDMRRSRGDPGRLRCIARAYCARPRRDCGPVRDSAAHQADDGRDGFPDRKPLGEPALARRPPPVEIEVDGAVAVAADGKGFGHRNLVVSKVGSLYSI